MEREISKDDAKWIITLHDKYRREFSDIAERMGVSEETVVKKYREAKNSGLRRFGNGKIDWSQVDTGLMSVADTTERINKRKSI